MLKFFWDTSKSYNSYENKTFREKVGYWVEWPFAYARFLKTMYLDRCPVIGNQNGHGYIPKWVGFILAPVILPILAIGKIKKGIRKIKRKLKKGE